MWISHTNSIVQASVPANEVHPWVCQALDTTSLCRDVLARSLSLHWPPNVRKEELHFNRLVMTPIKSAVVAKLKGLKLGFLLNFGSTLIKDGIDRIVNGLPEENLGVLASWRETSPEAEKANSRQDAETPR